MVSPTTEGRLMGTVHQDENGTWTAAVEVDGLPHQQIAESMARFIIEAVAAHIANGHQPEGAVSAETWVMN